MSSSPADCVSHEDMTNELFDGMLSDVESIEHDELNSSYDKELIGYLGTPIAHKSTATNNYRLRNPSAEIAPINNVKYARPESTMCMSRNAVLARENRKKKKDYVTNLEENIQTLNNQNTLLKGKTQEMEVKISDLTSEVEYLKGVIANQSTLSKLLNSVCTTQGVHFYSSFSTNNNSSTHQSKETGSMKRISSIDNDQENIPSPKVQKLSRRSDRNIHSNKHCPENSESVSNGNVESSGICLHVADEAVSLEFCSSCSKSASITKKAALVKASNILKERVGKRKK